MFVMQHLNRVQMESKTNLMTTSNLSVVFGPTLVRALDPHDDVLDMTSKNDAIEFILSNVKEIFNEDDE